MKKKNMENAIRHGSMTEELKRVDPAGYQIAYEKVKKIQDAQEKERQDMAKKKQELMNQREEEKMRIQ